MYLCIGKIVNTHGIKGEVRLLSKFERKDRVFIPNMAIYIGKNKEKQVIKTYRHHKNFDMITLEGFDNINQVLHYKGALVYVLKDDLRLSDDEYLDSDLIGLPIISDNQVIGSVKEIEAITDKNKILIFDYQGKEVLIPFVDEFVRVDIRNKQVIVTLIDGMINN